MGTVWLVGECACSFPLSEFHEYSLLVARAKVTTSQQYAALFLLETSIFLPPRTQHTLSNKCPGLFRNWELKFNAIRSNPPIETIGNYLNPFS